MRNIRYQLVMTSFLYSKSCFYDGNESIGFVHGKSNFFIEVLDELRLFIDEKMIFSEHFFMCFLCDIDTNY
jgi:hypothetical protein